MDTLKALLYIDTVTQSPSHSKLWSNVGYATTVWAFVYSVINDIEADVTLYLVFGAIVIGNRTILKLFTERHHDSHSKSTDPAP
jgi:hypothetical protein